MIISSQRFHSGVTAGAHRAMRRYVQLGSDSRNLGGDSLPDRRFDHTKQAGAAKPGDAGTDDQGLVPGTASSDKKMITTNPEGKRIHEELQPEPASPNSPAGGRLTCQVAFSRGSYPWAIALLSPA